jgi:cell division protein FtsB
MRHIPRIASEATTGFLRRNVRQILGLALLALFLHDAFGTHGFLAMLRTQKEIKQIREQIGKINAENKSLSNEVNALKTDPKAIERIAREDMGLARPGEIIYKLPDSAPPGGPQNPEPRK